MLILLDTPLYISAYATSAWLSHFIISRCCARCCCWHYRHYFAAMTATLMRWLLITPPLICKHTCHWWCLLRLCWKILLRFFAMLIADYLCCHWCCYASCRCRCRHKMTLFASATFSPIIYAGAHDDIALHYDIPCCHTPLSASAADAGATLRVFFIFTILMITPDDAAMLRCRHFDTRYGAAAYAFAMRQPLMMPRRHYAIAAEAVR